MATITEDYVSFEIAKLLKEKGFPQDPYTCNTVYTPKGKLSNNAKSFWNPFAFTLLGREYYMAPTQAMAMKWLREVHGLFISIGNDDLDYNWQIFDIKNRTTDLDPTCLTDSYAGYRKYELAVEAAIKYSLEHLI